MKYQKSSHVTYDVRYHLVWITKYRQGVLTEEIQKSLDKVLLNTCEKIGIVIIKIGYEKDHVHMYIRIPLNKAISEVVGYFISIVGEINGEIIANYVESQGKEEN